MMLEEMCAWKLWRPIGLLGRRTSKNDEQYGYNVRDELISADEASYAYDDIGIYAPTSVSEVGNRTIAEGKAYAANNLNQYTAIDDFTPQYDADGNQILIKTETGVWSVVYNAENRPIRWQSGDTVITMAFDRMGRRIEMRTVKDGVETLQRFAYDNYLCIQQLRGADNALFHSYVWDPTEPIATRPLVFQPASGEIAYYFHDGNKNVSNLVPSSGAPIHYAYTPFGIPSVSVPSENPFIFSSEYYDNILSLFSYTHRHYSPLDGRWERLDPAQENGNRYLFNRNNPLINVDVMGLITISWDSKIESPYNPTQFDRRMCPIKCFNGEPIQLVSIWSCKRPLAMFPIMISKLHHQYLCCDGKNSNCYGVQAKTLHAGDIEEKPTKKGDLIRPEVDPSGDCELRCVMPKEKQAACSGQCRMPEDYGLFSYNCQTWVECMTTTKAK